MTAGLTSGKLVAALVASCILPRDALALEPNEIFKRADPSVVVISTTDRNGKDLALGSGVIIAVRDVVTNCHVIADAARIAVKQGDVHRSAKLRYQDAGRDLCQILLDDAFPAGKPVSAMIPSDKVEVGQHVFAVGSPMGLEHTISRGIVSGLRGQKNSARLIQTDAPISKGSSGGGLFDGEGRLVGIVTFGIGEEGNLNFAIPTDWVGELAARNRDRSADGDADARPAPVAAVATEQPAAAGMPRTGDRWKYRLLDGRQPAGFLVIEVLDARGKTVSERITKEGQKGFFAERNVVTGTDSQKIQEVVALPGGFQLTELMPYLQTGQSLNTEARWRDLPVTLLLGGYGYGKQQFQMEARVMGREKVQVAAGTFDAVRVDMTGRKSIALDNIRVTCKYWYSTESMRAVKMSLEIKYTNPSFQSNPEIYELATFEPGPGGKERNVK